MLVLGIDPGVAITGFGLVVEGTQGVSAVDYGTLETPARMPLPERLHKLHVELAELIRRHRPEVMAIEELFFCRNVTTALGVGHARGVVLLAAAQAGLRVSEYTPMQVKQAVTGYGRASKAQIQDMIRLLLCLDHIPRPDDAADALAIAVCHAHSYRLSALADAN